MQFASGCIFPQAAKYWHWQEHWMCWTCHHQPEKPLSPLLLTPSRKWPACADGATSVPVKTLLSHRFKLFHFPQIYIYMYVCFMYVYICCFLNVISSLSNPHKPNQTPKPLHQNKPRSLQNVHTTGTLGKWSTRRGNNVKVYLHYITCICRLQQRWLTELWKNVSWCILRFYCCFFFFVFSLII